MSPDPITIFDRALLQRRRDSAARRDGDHDFLLREVQDRMIERLADVARVFDHALDIGGRDGGLVRRLVDEGRARRAAVMDRSFGYIKRARDAGMPGLVGDEEFLPIRDGSFDLIVSCLAMHWVNDLPGALVQANRALRPDGLFQAALFGGETLSELRHCLMDAELEVTGGVSPRVSPMVDLRDAAGLLQRAGFALPVADLDRIDVTYADPFRLFEDLRAMGEVNALVDRLHRPTARSVFLKALELYATRHADASGRLPVRVEVIFLHGWHPAESQPKPLPPGSGRTSLTKVLGEPEE